MKFINHTGQSVHLTDIDLNVTYLEDLSPQDISLNLVKKSRNFRQMVLLGLFSISEHDGSPFEKSLKKQEGKLENKMEKTEVEGKNVDEIEVKIRGHFYEAGGYAKVNRNLAIALHDKGMNVKIDPTAQNIVDISSEEISRLAPLRKNVGKNAIVIDSMVPSFGNMLGGKYKILYTTVESDTIPQQFVDCLNMYNEIWTVSDYCKEVISKYVDREIIVMPNSVDNKLYNENVEPYEFSPSLNPFVFVSVFGWSYRKGYDALLRAYLEEFTAEDPVTLLIVSRYQGKTNRSDKIKDTINDYIQKYAPENAPHIARFSKVISEEDMPRVYKACNSFVLFSRGEGWGLPYCFKKGTKIQAENGVKNIEDIQVWDKVFSGDNNLLPVSEIHKNNYDGEFVDIKSKLTQQTLSVTENHRFLAFSPKRNKKGHIENQRDKTHDWSPDWVMAKDLTSEHMLVYPIRKKWENKKQTIDIFKFLNSNSIVADKNCVWSKFSNKPNGNLTASKIASELGISKRQVYHYRHDGKVSKSIKQKIEKHIKSLDEIDVVKINRKIKVDKKLSRLLGYYVAEGSSSLNAIEFSFHANEVEYHNEVQSLIKEIFGIDSYKIIKNNKCRIKVNSSICSELFAKLCGSGASNKFISPYILSSSKKIIQNFLNGYINGDGHSNKNIITISTNSEKLAYQYQKLMLDMGLYCSLGKRRNSEEFKCTISGGKIEDKNWIEKNNLVEKSKETGFIYSNNDYIFIPIEGLEFYTEECEVYNFDVPEDHSYISNIVVAHNCESSLCGLPVIATNHSGHTMFLNKDNSTLVDIDRKSPLQPGLMHVHYWDNQIFPELKSDKFITDCRLAMRNVFENYEEHKIKNKALSQFISDNYNVNSVADKAADRLREIWSKIK